MEGKGLNTWKVGMFILIQGIVLSVISKLNRVLFQVYLVLETVNTHSGSCFTVFH